MPSSLSVRCGIRPGPQLMESSSELWTLSQHGTRNIEMHFCNGAWIHFGLDTFVVSASTFIRVEKIHTMDQLASAGAHHSRRNAPNHVNPDVKVIMLRGDGIPVTQLFVARLQKTGIKVPLKKPGVNLHGMTPRRQRIIALDVICAVGAEFFLNVNPVVWANQSLAYLEKTFGKTNVLSAVLHPDERVPHLHALIVPITHQGRLSAQQVFCQDHENEPEDMSGVRRGNGSTPFFRRLQREYHNLCLEFDSSLTAPVPGGVMTHRLVSDWREWAARAFQATPKLPPYAVMPPTSQDMLKPQDYAQRNVDVFRGRVEDLVSTLHAKAVQYDEQVLSNLHMQKTLRRQDKEIICLKEQLVATQKLCRQLQHQQEDVPLKELAEAIGLPTEDVDGKPYIVGPNGEAIPVAEDMDHRPYSMQTFEALPTLLAIQSLGISERDLLAGGGGVISQEQIERLQAYKAHFDIHHQLQNPNGKDLVKLVKCEPLSLSASQTLLQTLAANFGILESLLKPDMDLVNNIELGTNRWNHLVLMHKNSASVDGIAVTGSRPARTTGSLYEQYLGVYRLDAITIGSANAVRTVVVSNVIEAYSLLSVPNLAPLIRVVVSGMTKPERVAVRALDRPYPIVLFEYASGRRCGRHRKLRELLEAGRGRAVTKICLSDLRLGKATFESIALEVQRNPALGAKLAHLMGLAGTLKQSHKPSTDSPSYNARLQPPEDDMNPAIT